MLKIHSRTDDCNRYVFDVEGNVGEVIYTTDPYVEEAGARRKAEEWVFWFHNAPDGKAESIYYILQVPDTWMGPPSGGHRYSGLYFKIGRTKDVRRRLKNLQTGADGQLILHAMEPGSSAIEKELHKRFEADRRQGEWFSSSPELVRHVIATWKRNILLPPEYQRAVLELQDRIDLYLSIRRKFHNSKYPDMINPSINEKWEGTVFVDLIYSQIVRNNRNR